MPDQLTQQEQDAIAAYTGPITVCKPHAYTPGLLHEGAFSNSTHVNRMKQRGESTQRLIMAAFEAGHSPHEIARKHGMDLGTVRIRLRRAGVAV